MFAFILRRIRRDLNEHDLMPELVGCGARSLHAQEITNFKACDVSFVDDVAFCFKHEDPQKIMLHTALAIGFIYGACFEQGPRPNLKTKKTEAIIKFAGQGSTKHKKDFNESAQHQITFVTEHDGVQTLRIVKDYKHVGGYITETFSIEKETCNSTNCSLSTQVPLRKNILQNKNIACRTRVILTESFSRSILSFNSSIWTPLNAKQTRRMHTRYMGMYRGATKMTSGTQKQFADFEVLENANALEPAHYFASQRLRYAWRLLHFGFQSLLLLVKQGAEMKRSWTQLLQEDTQWLQRVKTKKDQVPNGDNLECWSNFLVEISNKKWKRLIARTARAASMTSRVAARVNHWRSTFKKIANSIQGINFEDNIGTDEDDLVQCHICGIWNHGLQGLRSHMSKDHKHYHVCNYYVEGDTCPCCLQRFATHNDFIKHLKGPNKPSKRCLGNLLHAHTPYVIPGTRRSKGVILAEKRNSERKVHQLQGPVQHQMLSLDDVAHLLEGDMYAAPETLIAEYDQSQRPPQDQTQTKVAHNIKDITPWLRPTAFIIHMFSGRRRQGDVQEHIEQEFGALNIDVRVVSLDIIFSSKCDLTQRTNLDYWSTKIQDKQIFGIIGGPPCETWSTARHLEHGPEPLRSAEQPWGLNNLTTKQFAQVDIGNKLLHVFVILLLHMIIAKGHACLEHPGLTSLHDKCKAASIWKLKQIEFVIASGMCNKVNFLQGLLGAGPAKPTTLLTANMPTLDSRLTELQSQPSTPWTTLRGKNEQGQYNTTKAKEYPGAMCKAIALAFRHSYKTKHDADDTLRLPDDKKCADQTNDLCVPLDPYLEMSIGQDYASYDNHDDNQY